MRRWTMIVGLGLWAGCQSLPQALALPPAILAIASEPASEAATDGDAAATASLSLTLLALRDPPAAPAVELAALAIATDVGRPFRGSSRLPTGTRWLAQDAVGALPQDATAQQPRAVATATVGRDLSARVLPGDDLPALRLQLAADGAVVVFVAVRAADPTDANTGDEGTAAGEELRLATPLAAGSAAALFVPASAANQDGIAGHALVLRHDGPATAAAMASARAALPAPPPLTAPPLWRLMTAAIGERSRRPALLALARDHQSTRLIDLLLAADEPALMAISAALANGGPLATTPEGAFAFERAALRALLPALERDELPPSLLAGLRRHLGVVGGDAGALRSLLAQSRDLGSFKTAVQEENIATLGDRNPALRVAAHDWLLAHGGSVSGYDPLSSQTERRQALRAFLVAQAAAVAEATK